MNPYHAVVRRAAAACDTPRVLLELDDGVQVGEIAPGWYESARALVTAPDGVVIGSLAALTPHPRSLTSSQLDALHDFAAIAGAIASSAPRNTDVFSRAVEESLDLILVLDVTAPSRGGPFIEYANTPLLRATGYAADDLIGKPYGILLSDDNEPAALRSTEQNFETGDDSEKELLVCRKDGSTFWMELTARPMTDAAGGHRHWIVVGRDITTRRLAHEQMAVLLNAIDAVEHHIEIYALQDGQYTLTFQNAAANSDTSEFLDTLFNESYIPGITPLREQIKAGKTVTVTPDGLEIRPLGKNAETLICIRQKAS